MLMSETDSPNIGVLQSFSPLENKLNWLLIAVPITVYFAWIEHDTGMSFVFSMIAIMPLALMETREGRLTRIWFVSLAGRRFARRARFACTRARDRTSIARLVILRAITRVVVTSLRLSRASCTRNRRRATSTPSKVWAVSAASSSRSVCSERWRSRRRVWPASKKRTMSSQTTTDRVFPRSSNSLSVERLESSAPSGGAIPKSTPLARFSQIARARRCDRRK